MSAQDRLDLSSFSLKRYIYAEEVGKDGLE
jgi:hypothetical protein